MITLAPPKAAARQTQEMSSPIAAPASKVVRLVSLDAFRGLIMITLMSAGFHFAKVAQHPDYASSPVWQALAFHTEHPDWVSTPKSIALDLPEAGKWLPPQLIVPYGVSYWDLIQPSFMFMVGVAMPFSYAKRKQLGDPAWKTVIHVIGRCIALILLGVVLSSMSEKLKQPNWIFVNVLAQIGLGYGFVYLFLGRPRWIQLTGAAVILVGTWLAFVIYTNADASAGIFGHWTKGKNVFAAFDGWFLPLFPSKFEVNKGGYTTLNFIPAIVTMLLGLMCGELIQSIRRRPWAKVGFLVLGALICLLLGTLAGATVCPIIKRLWTPSWALYSGAYVILILALFYTICDVINLKKWAFPLVVVGMNSIVAYLMSQTMKGWTWSMVKKFFVGNGTGWTSEPLSKVLSQPYAPVIESSVVLVVFWLILYWLYRQRAFIRI